MVVVPTRIVPSVSVEDKPPHQVERGFRALLDAGARLEVAGSARRRPRSLLSRGYTPKHELRVFDTTFYLTNVRQNEDIRFYVGYVLQGEGADRRVIHPRIFYKDMSLIWRSASHYVRSAQENWIGKGDVETYWWKGESYFGMDERLFVPIRFAKSSPFERRVLEESDDLINWSRVFSVHSSSYTCIMEPCRKLDKVARTTQACFPPSTAIRVPWQWSSNGIVGTS